MIPAVCKLHYKITCNSSDFYDINPQQLYNMETTFLHRMLTLAGKALVVNLFVSLPVSAFILLMFYDFDFSFREWSMLLLTTVASGWLLIYGSLVAGKVLLQLTKKLYHLPLKPSPLFRRLPATAAVLFLTILLYSCKGGIKPFGKRVDLATGLSTNYTGMVPAETKMIMNNEVLNHADIPLGEKFTIVNSGVEGLTVKNNQVSVGCSLLISDKSGKQILFEPDLFKTGGVFHKDSASALQCKVNTGAPME